MHGCSGRMPARWLVVATLLLLAIVPDAARAQMNGKLKWGPAPAVFPAGAKMAVVNGDPTKSGPFTVDLSMPNGYRIMPHYHPTDEKVTVKTGTFLYGMGDKVAKKEMKSMKVGQSGNIPANMHHYAMARGRVVVEINSTGPFVLTYVDPKDDPQYKKPKS